MNEHANDNPKQPRGMSVIVPMLWFAIFIIAGAWLLRLPMCQAAGQPVSWMESIFTAIAAVTCTGLSLRDPGSAFSATGQFVLTLLMAGGAVVILVTGARAFSHSSNQGIAGWGRGCFMRVLKICLIAMAVVFIFILGTAAIFLTTPREGEQTFVHRLFLSLFHAISAISNTGWTLTNFSVWQLHVIIMPLVIFGGLGWPVWRDLLRRLRLSSTGISMRTRHAMTWTLGLYIAGTLLITLGQLMPHSYAWLRLGIEGRNAPPPLSVEQVAQVYTDASFTSICARTTGFSVLSIDAMQPATRLVILLLMFIGGIPGSTAGGIGVTSCAVIFPAAWATLRGRRRTPFEDMAFPMQLRLAWSVLLSQATLIVVATFLLTLSEPFSLEKLLFEVVSASCNAGQSLGITGSLTSAGKCVIMTCMCVGRVLPICLWIRSRSV